MPLLLWTASPVLCRCTVVAEQRTSSAPLPRMLLQLWPRARRRTRVRAVRRADRVWRLVIVHACTVLVIGVVIVFRLPSCPAPSPCLKTWYRTGRPLVNEIVWICMTRFDRLGRGLARFGPSFDLRFSSTIRLAPTVPAGACAVASRSVGLLSALAPSFHLRGKLPDRLKRAVSSHISWSLSISSHGCDTRRGRPWRACDVAPTLGAISRATSSPARSPRSTAEDPE